MLDLDIKFLPVIIAGGSGKRLWPLSRSMYPKQFLSLIDKFSLLQNTIFRIAELQFQSPPLIISNNKHRSVVTEQLHQIGINKFKVILEPVSRNTAPAIALASLYALKDREDPLMLVLSADHVIKNTKLFKDSITIAKTQAIKGKIVTFGISPSRAETSYGYIHQGKEIANSVYKIDFFVEKPDQYTAQQYLREGHYLWNSGIFLFKASIYLEELKKFRPDIIRSCQLAMDGASSKLDCIYLKKETFSNCPNESIDYAVMEKTDHGVVVPLNTQWYDVGSWTSLWEISHKDHNRNATRGDVITFNSKRNYIYAENSLVSTIGVDDFVIIQTKDVTLVAKQDQVKNIKKIMDMLKYKNRNKHIFHYKEFPPSRHCHFISRGKILKIKKLSIKPGQRLASQILNHFSTHYVVISGTAKIIRGNEIFFILENESIFIPIGVGYYIENPRKIFLEVIEIQTSI